MITTMQRNALLQAVKRHPIYISGDDDLSSDNGILQAAAYVLDRLAEDRPEGRARYLMKEAADKLNAYCEQENGDLNDSLAMEIERYLAALRANEERP